MKRKEFTQIKELALKELGGKAKNLQKEIANLQLDKNMKKLKDLKIVSKKKKDLAKVLTVIKQKELLMQLESKIEDKKSDGAEKVSKKAKEVSEVSDALRKGAKQ